MSFYATIARVVTSLGVLLSLLVAFLPILLYTLVIWWLDRYEREPGRLVLIAFVWGAAPAVIMSVGLEIALSSSLTGVTPLLLQELAAGSVLAPLIEETVKGLALLLLFLLARRDFDNVLDGVVYGAVIGFGFAMTENVLYFVEVLGPAVSQFEGRWMSVVLWRSLLFGFSHAFYTAIIGAGFGLAADVRLPTWRWIMPAVGLALAVAFHAVHNLGIALAAANALALLVAIMADWAGVVLLLIIVLLAWRQERRWIASELRSEVGRTLTPDEYAAAISYGRRLRLWFDTLGQGGLRAALRSSRHYHYLARLAFLKRRLGATRSDEPKATDLARAIEQVRTRLAEYGR